MRRLLLLALLALVLPAVTQAQGGQNFPGPCPSGWSAQLQVTAAASITLPFQSGSCVTDFFITLNVASTTVTAITGPFIAGSEIGITITQDVTGGRTFTLPANFLNVPATQAGSLASTAYTFQYCGAAGSGTSCPAGDWQNTDVGPAGTGTVTVVSAGTLTSTAVVTGGGGQAIQTPSATTTLDSSGNLTLAGHVSTGAGCTPAGATAAGGICMTDSAATGWTPTAGFSYIRASSVSNNLVCSLNGGGETTSCFGGSPSLDQVTGSAAQTTITETAASKEITFAGVETANLTYPYVFVDTNSTNNNTNGALGVGCVGTSTGCVPLIVNEATVSGDLADFYTGGAWTSGVFSGGTKRASINNVGAYTSAGTTAFFTAYTQGSTSGAVAPCSNANTACFQAPTAVTAYVANVPGAAPTNNNSAMIFSNASPAVGSFAKIPQTAFLSADYTNAGGAGSFTSLTNLSFSVEANTNYHMVCTLVWSASAATTGPEYQITGPASPTAVVITMASAITAVTTASAAATAFSTAVNPVGAVVTSGTNEWSQLTMDLRNGVNAGTVQVQASGQGTGTLTIRNGSGCQIQ